MVTSNTPARVLTFRRERPETLYARLRQFLIAVGGRRRGEPTQVIRFTPRAPRPRSGGAA